MWVSEGVWVICAKPPFLLDLDVPIKMFAKNLADKHWEGLCSSCMAKYALVCMHAQTNVLGAQMCRARSCMQTCY